MSKNNRRPRWMRPASVFVTLLMTGQYVPYQALGDTAAQAQKTAKLAPKPVASRLLTAKEMASMTGATGNPYFCGAQKWDVVHKGVNMRTGEFTMSSTDMSFEGGYGVPVALTRTYSSNSNDDCGFGVGWACSLDLRTSAGGLLKSASAPVRSVPTTFHERPSSQQDPRISSSLQPVLAVLAEDASGAVETVQRDVDGILSNPAWDRNLMETTYDDTSTPPVLKTVVVHTPEGTDYTYANVGSYVNGEFTWDGQQTGNGEPSPVLKIHTIVDRHGNTTTFNYSTTVQHTFQRANGAVQEYQLNSVDMPGSRSISLTWSGTGLSDNRILAATSDGESVTYGYDGYGHLTSVTTPGGKTTQYHYATLGQSGLILDGIIDPRGLETDLTYTESTAQEGDPYYLLTGVCKIHEPNGFETYFDRAWLGCPTGVTNGQFSWGGDANRNAEYVQYMAGTVLFRGDFRFPQPQDLAADSGSLVVEVLNASTGWTAPFERRTFDAVSQDLTGTVTWFDGTVTRATGVPSYEGMCEVAKTSTYNFMHNPISQVVEESVHDPSSWSNLLIHRTMTTETAYWDQTKYYQKKAERTDGVYGSIDTGYRYTYSDYYEKGQSGTDPVTGYGVDAGDYGQVKAVYDAKYGQVSPGTGAWRDSTFTVSGVPAAMFDYDSHGRAVAVKKLAPTATVQSPTYVLTSTLYGGPHGEAYSVTEDDGAGNLRRTTESGLSGDPSNSSGWLWTGKPIKTRIIDSANSTVLRELTTTADVDGLVSDVTRTDGTHNDLLVHYGYGTSGVTNGQPVYVKDVANGLEQSIDYVTSGPGIGQVYTVVDHTVTGSGKTTYDNTATYAYNSFGDRDTAHFKTTAGNYKFHYKAYASGGFADNPQRRLLELNKMSGVGTSDTSGSDSSDDYFYHYDDTGRLWKADFALSGQSSGAYDDPLGNGSNRPTSLCEAAYNYDAAGRVLSVSYGWGVLSGTYAWTNLRAYDSAYDNGYGLKTAAHTYNGNGSGWTQVTADDQTYGYETTTDYLTGASYGTGSPFSNGSWSYDAAGNRANTGYAYDNLNKMTADPSHTYQNDLLGRRTFRDWGSQTTAVKYTWDDLDRMTALQQTTTGATYRYRADGMRCQKVEGITINANLDNNNEVSGYDDVWASNKPTWRFFYDGQMPVVDDHTYAIGSVIHIDRTAYVPGPRGIDCVDNWTGLPYVLQSTQYPFYDCHGNNVGSVSRSGSGSYSLGGERVYDAWGLAHGSADSQQRYCANLGHRQDDETGTYTGGSPDGDGLVYMRARYYEPTVGRFVSEDPQQEGNNWYVYGLNAPPTYVDYSGRSASSVTLFTIGVIAMALAIYANGKGNSVYNYLAPGGYSFAWARAASAKSAAVLLASISVACFAGSVNQLDSNSNKDLNTLITVYIPLGMLLFGGVLELMTISAGLAKGSIASSAVYSATLYGSMCFGVLLSMNFD